MFKPKGISQNDLKTLEKVTGLKSIWKRIESEGFRFYCVGCNRERRLAPPAKAGSPKFFAHILVTASFLTVLTFHWLQIKGFVFFVIPVGLVFEAIYRMKMRDALVCPDCAFDPVLYLVDQKKAVRQVEEVWRKKFEEKGFPYPGEKKRPSRSAASKTA